ncbi:MAG: hypothetical protein LC777_10145 [Actinobacteria bacterium]|nr:hypothetical protein [Actinomycetota bacterium]
MSVQINVQLDERGPARMRLCQRDRLGQVLELERKDPYLTACEEEAWERLLAEGRRLPCGTVDVLVAEDPLAGYPPSEVVGRAIAARAA